jgi:hypothetical protein
LTTTPEVRLEGSDSTATHCLCAAPDGAPRTVTTEQLDQAVYQLRERRGRPAAEQMQAVLRALDLTVAPRNEHRR